MYPYTRRDAIAQFACLEQIAAMYLSEHSQTLAIKEGARWIADRLGEVEPCFLAKADTLEEPWRDAWVDTAERCLAFYTSELRRLQDWTGHPAVDYLPPMTGIGGDPAGSPRDGSTP